ncbi:hypothetical protein EON65_50995 [archaeon]|nr:MAG: hypothetical protein EON65_50995 [archaeon]
MSAWSQILLVALFRLFFSFHFGLSWGSVESIFSLVPCTKWETMEVSTAKSGVSLNFLKKQLSLISKEVRQI